MKCGGNAALRKNYSLRGGQSGKNFKKKTAPYDLPTLGFERINRRKFLKSRALNTALGPRFGRRPGWEKTRKEAELLALPPQGHAPAAAQHFPWQPQTPQPQDRQREEQGVGGLFLMSYF